MSTLEPTADKPSDNDLPLGTTPPYARMHKWLKRGLFVCLFGLVIEGSSPCPPWPSGTAGPHCRSPRSAVN